MLSFIDFAKSTAAYLPHKLVVTDSTVDFAVESIDFLVADLDLCAAFLHRLLVRKVHIKH